MSNNHNIQNRNLYLTWQDTQPVGYFSYQLYRLGWRSSLHAPLPLLQHWLLSIFFDYRRGFGDGAEWIDEYRLDRRFHE